MSDAEKASGWMKLRRFARVSPWALRLAGEGLRFVYYVLRLVDELDL